jgi:hypothetical protein
MPELVPTIGWPFIEEEYLSRVIGSPIPIIRESLLPQSAARGHIKGYGLSSVHYGVNPAAGNKWESGALRVNTPELLQWRRKSRCKVDTAGSFGIDLNGDAFLLRCQCMPCNKRAL